MRSKRLTRYIVNTLILFVAIAFSFPGVLGLFGQGGSGILGKPVFSYSYSSPSYNVDVKDIKNKNDINFIYQELEKSKLLGDHYPDSMQSVTHEGSLFIVKRFKGRYSIDTSICWYGAKSNICLVQRDSSQGQYMEVTSELQNFFLSKFMGKKLQ